MSAAARLAAEPATSDADTERGVVDGNSRSKLLGRRALPTWSVEGQLVLPNGFSARTPV